METNHQSISIDSLNAVPVGLLFVADLVRRFPDRALEILISETQRRKRDHVIVDQIKSTLTWNPAQTFRFLFFTGLLTFGFTWVVSVVSSFARFYDATRRALNIQLPLFDLPNIDLSSILPVATHQYLTNIPEYGLMESLYVTVGVVLFVAFVKFSVIIVHWKSVQLISVSENVLREEIRTLEAWETEIRSKYEEAKQN